MRNRKRLIAAIASPLIALAGLTAVATPASAHTSTCTHGDHYSGHSPAYLMKFVRQYDQTWGNREHVHVVEKWTDRTWYGSYKTYAGTFYNYC